MIERLRPVKPGEAIFQADAVVSPQGSAPQPAASEANAGRRTASARLPALS
ncbi:hypothetical protein BIFANG_02622 [Bifidobacterium angulatum DSM 20098 = JCM 7096]|uniref:Uncharacterized protein n=1 Tax=Bifidobacterium angulatum DSM 20098 = JCM 7096 TaxID=518635 RepID=C4FE82_9BIFI|nr:hypothetical protein BIFANG_02622 [Bifidobacterium angulatum DSM 20098 = JCM 7096]